VRLNFSYDMVPSCAYIIRVVGNAASEEKAARCALSCEKAGQPYDFWDAYDGLADEIKPPAHHNAIMDCIKVTDHYLTRGEVACALSHISLWAKCVLEDKPLVILEHDSLMAKPYTQHAVFNSICYLGSHEQVKLGWQVSATPPHASEGHNYHFLCRAHAYAIDPAVAKNLLSYVIKMGICTSLDMLIRADLFPIHQMGIYAYNVYESPEETTIKGRPLDGRTTKRNDGLKV
jgi:GR25 family glycosyltransferase involved in LPS biosynthesis